MSATCPNSLPTSVFRPGDIARAASGGLAANRLRAVLSALGIAIGIASMVAVLGIASSSRAELLATLDRLGTNLLAVTSGTSFVGDDVELPDMSTAMVERIGPVEATASTTAVDAAVFRNELMPAGRTGGLAVHAADADLLDVLNGTLASGRFLDTAPAGLPVTVLGATAAERLGGIQTGMQVLIDDERFGVIGVLEPLELVPALDSAAIVPRDIAHMLFATSTAPSTLYVRTTPAQIDTVSGALAATANPESPEAVEVSRPSDALAARDATESTFTPVAVDPWVPFAGVGAAVLIGAVAGVYPAVRAARMSPTEALNH